ncbi:hypothetical protein JTE90_002293 [Oedothorax gibbosus]|uniref:Uncharacterized protein n=1 Tax=Oedothorax gibbosus TaxID=931172 RepID=A0AAV6TPE5_9ARAC|nr:hypothetical protein JTE90_002293 [Oedothorax gibbosus]
MQINHEENVIQRNKYIELALVVDQNLTIKMDFSDVPVQGKDRSLGAMGQFQLTWEPGFTKNTHPLISTQLT